MVKTGIRPFVLVMAVLALATEVALVALLHVIFSVALRT